MKKLGDTLRKFKVELRKKALLTVLTGTVLISFGQDNGSASEKIYKN